MDGGYLILCANFVLLQQHIVQNVVSVIQTWSNIRNAQNFTFLTLSNAFQFVLPLAKAEEAIQSAIL